MAEPVAPVAISTSNLTQKENHWKQYTTEQMKPDHLRLKIDRFVKYHYIQ